MNPLDEGLPQEMTKESRRVVSFDGTPLHFNVYRPLSSKASLLIVHGAGEYADRYDAMASLLAASGISIYALDLRGYGDSGGPRAYVKSFDVYAADLEVLQKIIISDTGDSPFLLGHSMGGTIAAYTTAFHLNPGPRGLILTSPCFGIALRIPPLLRMGAKIMSILRPHFLHPKPNLPLILTHDKDIVNAYKNDTRIIHAMSSKSYVNLLEVIARTKEMAQGVTCPTWIGQAGEDHVVQAEQTKFFCDNLSTSNKSFNLYPGLFHEILQETNRREIWDEIRTWIAKHL